MTPFLRRSRTASFLSFASLAALSILAPRAALVSAPLSRSLSIDFFRDVPSRNLEGLATRSDGRLVAGPVLTDLSGPAIADILWTLESAHDDNRWLIGTGPDGKIFEVTLDLANNTFGSRELVDLDDTHVFALRRLPDGSLLAGTSPHGTVYLIRDEKIAARVTLPVDSIHDLLLSPDGRLAYVATGNPGRIYELDIAAFSSAGLDAAQLRDASLLETKGLRLLGEIKDRNVRRLALLGDNLVAGSAPKGNLYTLPRSGGDPLILQDNRDAEIATLLPQPNGDLYAAVVFSNQQAETRLNRPPAPRAAATASPESSETPPADPSVPQNLQTSSPVAPPAPVVAPRPPIPQFPGRSAIVYFPKNGLPETVVARNNLAFYALARRGDTLIIAGGEQGDVLGYDVSSRLSLTFAGTDSAQINQIVPIPDPTPASQIENRESKIKNPRRFLLLRNNAPGLALLDFAAPGLRQAETRRFDLGSPATLGALRLPRIRNLDANALGVSLRTTFASDEAEAWTPWTAAPLREDGWFAPGQRGHFVKLRFTLPAEASTAQLDKPDLHFLPQNRRPALADFRIAPPGFTLAPPASQNEFSPPPSTLGQLLGGSDQPNPAARRGLNSTAVFPQPGMQIVTWTLTDADNDELRSTFSIRPPASDGWIDLAVNSDAGFAQFDTASLADGVYSTRLVVTEQAPRAFTERLTATFETDDLVIDKTPPAISEVKVSRTDDALLIAVAGRDEVSLLIGAEFVFNNGYRAETTQPDDAIRDSRAETFTLRLAPEKALHATAVEILLYDEFGNASSRRVTL